MNRYKLEWEIDCSDDYKDCAFIASATEKCEGTIKAESLDKAKEIFVQHLPHAKLISIVLEGAE